MFYGDEIVRAFYSSNAGGFTENNENVWDMEARPYLRGKIDSFAKDIPAAYRDGLSEAELPLFLQDDFAAHSRDAPVSSRKHFRWTKSVDVDVPQAWLQKNKLSIGKLRDAVIEERGISGRVVKLELRGTKGSTVIERELNVRRLFGGLKSGLFVMEIRRDSKERITGFSFQGAGFGHGVGMCQTGAIGMAAGGRKYKEMLTHYYRDIDIRKLY